MKWNLTERRVFKCVRDSCICILNRHKFWLWLQRLMSRTACSSFSVAGLDYDMFPFIVKAVKLISRCALQYTRISSSHMNSTRLWISPICNRYVSSQRWKSQPMCYPLYNTALDHCCQGPPCSYGDQSTLLFQVPISCFCSDADTDHYMGQQSLCDSLLFCDRLTPWSQTTWTGGTGFFTPWRSRAGPVFFRTALNWCADEIPVGVDIEHPTWWVFRQSERFQFIFE